MSSQNSKRFPLGDWTPDSPNYWSEGAITIQNALPTKASPNYESQPSIALSSIGGISQNSYTANAVTLATSAYLSSSSITGLSNGKSFSCSVWFRFDAAGSPLFIDLNNSGAGEFDIRISAGNQIQIFGTNSSGTTILNMYTSANSVSPSSTWHNLLVSVNLATGATNMFLDNVSNNTTVTATNDTLAWVGSNNYIGSAPDTGQTSQWSEAEIWWDTTFIDFSSSGNRALFIDSNGLPVNLGSTGQTPTGSTPKIYMKSQASQVGTNSGSGGNFTLNGTATIASSSPSSGASTNYKQYLGAYSTVDSTDIPHAYAGTSLQLAEITATSANNLSKSGGYNCATYWKFTSMAGIVYATDLADNIQSMTIGGTAFADLAGSPPKAQCIAQWGQQIVLGNTSGGTYGGSPGGAVPNRIWGCQIGVPTNWPDPLTNAGAADQAFVQDNNANYGAVQHITNCLFMGLVFQQTGITRALYQGAPTVWSFDDYEKKIGLYCPNSVVSINENMHFFVSDSGFYFTDGYSVVPIGHNQVDRTFLADLNTAYLSHVRGSFDPVTKLIKWVYPSVNMTLQGGFAVCDKMIAYNYVDKRWSDAMVNQDIDIIFPALTLAYTMEQLDSVNSNLDLITPSLDDPYWNGGVPTVGVFGIQQIGSTGSYASYWGSFSGPALTATLDTKIVNPNPGGRSYSSEYKPIVLGAILSDVSGYVGTQNLLSDSVTWIGPGTPETRTGKISQRSDSVYKRYRMVISGGFTNALGFETEEQPSGFA